MGRRARVLVWKQSWGSAKIRGDTASRGTEQEQEQCKGDETIRKRKDSTGMKDRGVGKESELGYWKDQRVQSSQDERRK